jgi:ABC-type ATPase with predicted acetyltransferase domain
MGEFSISRSFSYDGAISKKASMVMRMFGLSKDKLKKSIVANNCRIDIEDSDIVYITGPSGAGKSVILNQIQRQVSKKDRINLSQITLSRQKRVIDCIADESMLGSLRFLNKAGLSDVFCVLNRPAYLSEGQKWRFKLAMAMAAEKKFIFADEFCSNLDRITAGVIAHNVYRFAKKHGVTFILASSHEDILADLQPDVLVVKEFAGVTKVIYKLMERQNGKVQYFK